MKLCKKQSQFRISKRQCLIIVAALLLIIAASSLPSYGAGNMIYSQTGQNAAWTGTPTIAPIPPTTAATSHSLSAGIYVLAQSFTVPTGPLVLDKIAISMNGSGSATPYTLRLVDLGVQSGAAIPYKPETYSEGTDLWDGTVIWSEFTSGTGTQQVVEFDLTGDAELVLIAGHTYVFEITGTVGQGGFNWFRGADAYAEGSGYKNITGSTDRMFIHSTGNPRTMDFAVYLIGAYNWDGSSNNSWSTGDNWQGNSSPSGAVNEILTFGSRDDGDRLVTGVDDAYTDIIGISFSGAAGNYTITGTGSLDITAGGTVGQGEGGNTHTITVEFITNSGGGIIFNGADNLTLSGILSGDGDIIKEGTGALLLNGNNTYTGATTLSAGTLGINGSIVSEVTVNGGRLMGTGTISNNVTINSGGTIAPGNSIGTLTIDGDYVLGDGATYDAEVLNVGGTLTSDLIDATGTATLEDGSTINVINFGTLGSIQNGDQFTIISAAGGITDGGVTVSDYSVVENYTGAVVGVTDYVITAIVRQITTNNNYAMFEAMNNDYSTATGDFATLLGILNDHTILDSAALNQAAEMLSPITHASVREFNIQMTQDLTYDLTSYLAARRHGTEYMAKFDTLRQSELLMADATGSPEMLTYVVGETERLRQQLEDADKEIHTFVRPFGVWTNQGSADEFTGYQAQSFGAQFGIDKIFRGNWILGLGGSYAHSELDFDHGAGDATIDSFRVGPYASYFEDRWHVDSSVSVGYHLNKTARDIQFPGVDRTADADYLSWDFSGYVGAGYDFSFKKWTLTPSVSIQYTRYRNEAFEEEGAEDAGLDVQARTQESLLSTFGLRLYTTTMLYDMKLAPELFAGYSHEFMDAESIDSRFLGGTSKFTTNIDTERDNSFFYGAGVSGLLGDKTSAFFRYECETYGGNDNTALKAGLTIIF